MDPRTSGQDVMRCDLCETAVVQMHCDACFVNLCKACVGEHFSTDLSKPHTIVDFKDRKTTLIYPKCKSHNTEICEMYCNQCDIPVCNTCIASDQHLGHKFLKILQVLSEKKEKIIKEHTELNEKIFPTYQDIASDIENRLSQIEKEYGDLSTAIIKQGEDWHREIDKLVKKLKAEVDEMKNTQLDTLQKQLDEIKQKMSDIKDEMNSIDIALDSTDISKVLNILPTADEYRKLPNKIMFTMPKFSPRKIQEDQLYNFKPGSLEFEEYGYKVMQKSELLEAESSPQVKQLLDEPEIATTIDIDMDTGYKQIYSVACLSDEEIWTSGESNMKLYSVSQRSLLKSIRTKSGGWPWGITVTKGGDLVYTDYKDGTVNIVKNEKIEEVIRLQNWIPQGVCSTSSDDLLVIMHSDDSKQSKVVVYSGFTEKQTIQSDDKSKPLYSTGPFMRYITENRNLDICVADSEARALVVVNQAGTLRFRYTGHTPAPKNKPFNPREITTDSQSHILTADYNNNCVHIIDQDGQFLRYINCGLSSPWGLCIDMNDNLFVSERFDKNVKKIKYLK